MNRRRSLLRAFGMGGASLVVAGVLVAGVGVPANAVDLSIHSYRLSYPTSVTDSAGASDAFAWRDVARDYSTRVPIAPASPVVQLGKAGASLYGTGAGIQLVHAGVGYSQRITGPDAYPASGGKPSHVLQSEWDSCSGGSPSLVSSLRSIATAKLGGVNCPAVKAGWGSKVATGWAPVAGGQDYASGWRTGSGCGVKPSLPTFANERNFSFQLQGHSLTTGGTQNQQAQLPAQCMAQLGVVNSVSTWAGRFFAHLVNPSTGQTALIDAGQSNRAALSCSSSWTEWDADLKWSASVSCTMHPTASSTNTYINGWRLAGASIQTYGAGNLTGNGIFGPVPSPYAPLGCGGISGCGDDGSSTPVKLAVTSTYQNGQKVTCTSDGFLQKNGERIPLPCEPLPAAGHNYGPELSRVVEVVPVSEVGYVYGSNPAREVAKITPSQPIKDYAAAHPECATTRCTLDLVKSGVSCFDRPTGCENWKDETSTGTGHGYECKYGGKGVALSECDVYGPVFKSENRDAGHAYGPPAGGSGGETSAPHNPGTGPGGSECFPNGYGPANPVEHVLVPVTCALKDSLVPRGFVIGEAAGQVAAAADAVGVGKLGDAIGSLGSTFSIGSHCVGGLPFRFELFGAVIADARIFDACQAPWDGIAPFVKNTLGALLLGSVVLAGARYLAAAFGFTGISTGIGAAVSQGQQAQARDAAAAAK